MNPTKASLGSLEAMQRLSGSTDGFGGDLRYGTADALTPDASNPMVGSAGG